MKLDRHFSFKKIIPGIILLVLVFSLFLVSGQLIGPVFDFSAGFIFKIQKPINVFFQNLDPILKFVARGQRLIEENERLRRENIDLISQTAELFELKAENEVLRQSLNLKSSNPNHLVMAKVVGQSRDVFGHFLTIDKGFQQGISPGLMVVASGRLLVGRVVDVQKSISRVRLITDPNSKITAQTAKTKTSGILKGAFGNFLIFDEVNKDDLLLFGDLVLSSGKDGQVAANYVLGKISEIDFTADNLFKKAQVRPLVDFQKLNQVLVVLP